MGTRLVANKVSVIASVVSLLTVASATRTVPSEQCDALLCAMIAHKFKSRCPNGKMKKARINPCSFWWCAESNRS